MGGLGLIRNLTQGRPCNMKTHTIDPDQWVDKYSDYLFNYTITRVRDRETANDLVAETFLAGLRSMKNFKGESTERTWLVSILKRKIIDHYRRINSAKGKAEVQFTYRDQEEGDRLEEQIADLSGRNAQQLMENEELGKAIMDCLEQLNQRQAAIFKMKTLEDADTETVCNEFGITPSNLWVIIHRTRTALAKCLEKTWF